MGTVWELFGDCLGTVWGLFGDSLGTLWGLFGDCLGTVWGLERMYERTNERTNERTSAARAGGGVERLSPELRIVAGSSKLSGLFNGHYWKPFFVM